MESIPKDGTNSDSSGVSSGKKVNQQVTHNDTIIDKLRVSLLGFDEVLQEVGNLGVVVGILALKTRDQMFKRDTSNVAQVGGTNSHDGVLVKEEIQEGHLTDSSEAEDVREDT